METMNQSVGSMLRKSRYTMARLGAHGDRKLQGQLRSVHDDLMEANDAFLRADDHRIDAQADFDEIEMQAHDRFNDLQLNAAMVAKRDLDDPTYRALFPKGLTAIKKMQGEALEMEVARAIAVLKDLPSAHPLAAHLKHMLAVQAAWVKPRAALDEAVVKRAVAESALDKAKQAWLDGYDALHGALQSEYPRNRGFVRSFFPSPARKKKVAPPAPQPAAKAA